MIQVVEDTGCTKAKTLGYKGRCINCPFDECLEKTGIERNREKIDEAAGYYRAGLTQAQIAKKMGVSKRSVQRWLSEAGK